jgi:CxxC motif-containing protein (DUF1111 family)
MKMFHKTIRVLTASSAVVIAGCGALPGDGAAEQASAPLAGNHMKGISDADFNAVQANFVAAEGIGDGLGPIFNNTSCGGCHNLGAVGGAGTAIERRFGKLTPPPPSTAGVFDPLANKGGSLRQLQSNPSFTNSLGHVCPAVPIEVEPAAANVRNVGRLTTPLFGLGLVDAMPDQFFRDLATLESTSTVPGIATVVSVLLPDPLDPSQSIGSQRVARFGWKGGVPSLVQFAADAYVNEMGITTQHCSNGTSVTAFATESAPNGTPIIAECEDGKPGVDDAVGNCKPGGVAITETQDDVANFTKFMTFLSPPGRTTADDSDLDGPDATAPSGRKVFDRVGCAGCHYRKAFVTPLAPFNGVPGGKSFHPFSDFLVHDMGALGDHIGNAGDSEPTTRLMRTAPLWGLRFRTLLLHDGRATTVSAAITAHAGQGAAAATAFGALSAADSASLLQFLGTL